VELKLAIEDCDYFVNLQLRYDSELKRYLKTTGLRAKDLKAIAKTQPKSKSRHNERSSSSQQSAAAAATSNTNTQLAAQAAFMGLPLASMPMAVGMPAGMLGHAGAMSMLPHFSQVWTGQQYAGQPASAAMMGFAGHLAQGLPYFLLFQVTSCFTLLHYSNKR
jgi:hypothetical protein